MPSERLHHHERMGFDAHVPIGARHATSQLSQSIACTTSPAQAGGDLTCQLLLTAVFIPSTWLYVLLLRRLEEIDIPSFC